MTYIYFTSVVNYRINIDSDTKNPEIISKFTTETNAPKKKKPVKKDKLVVDAKAEVGEVFF